MLRNLKVNNGPTFCIARDLIFIKYWLKSLHLAILQVLVQEFEVINKQITELG